VATLDAGTTLHARGWRHRELDLERGRLQLQVAPSSKALQLRAGDSTIRDIGTTFQVERLHDGLVEVALLEGAVEVSNGAAQHTLAPGQQLQVPSGRIQPGPALSSTAAAEGWLHGQLVFDATPLSIVVERMNRYGRTAGDRRSGDRRPGGERHVPRRRRTGTAVGAGTGLVRGWPDAPGWRAGTAPHVLRRPAVMAGPGALQWGLLRPCSASRCWSPRRLPPCGRAGRHPGLDVGWPAAPALQQWARQSGIALLFDARELDGLRNGTHGHRDAAAALKELVAGMPVTILRTPPADSSSAASASRRRRRRRSGTRGAAPAHAPAAPPQVELAPIHVTGSRLPRTSVQTTLPVTIIDRDDILRSGYGSLFDLLRHLPGMNGHPAMSTSRSGDSQYLPVGAATTTSLDGMGPRATLFLVNGRRLPRYPMVSLEQGGLTDLGGIPLSFVERIELVRGGASAIYGADAMSGVVNIILRDQADGPEAMLQTGLSRRGDAGQYRVQAATGGVRDGAATAGSPASTCTASTTWPVIAATGMRKPRST
jgi:ferric-dicitrate binding protein FerR (iron transport regulator)